MLGGNSLCGVLRNAPAAQIVQTNEGTFWRGGACRLPNSLASLTNAGAPNCPALDITVDPLDPAAPPSALAQIEQATLAPLRPVKVLRYADDHVVLGDGCWQSLRETTPSAFPR